MVPRSVAIVGVGLMGGSLAAALRQLPQPPRLVGVGRSVSRMNQARATGLIDDCATDLAAAARSVELLVFCTPVDQIAAAARTAAAANPALLLTDAGSVKGPICAALADIPQFVGAHPIAGSHRQGFEHADPLLYAGKMCVITPLATTAANALQAVENFWQAVGMRTVCMSPEQHDTTLARTSHLPHAVACVLAAASQPADLPYAGTGLRDTTRIAAGDPELWASILLANCSAVIDCLAETSRGIAHLEQLLTDGDRAALVDWLKIAQRHRQQLDTPEVH